MQVRRQSDGRPAVALRLSLLLVLLAGFLTMHGFLAMTAPAHEPVDRPANEHASGHLTEQPPGQVTEPVMSQDVRAMAEGFADVAGAPGPGEHAPVGHHDLLAGCVVALVGIAAVTLAVSLLRSRPLIVARARVGLAWLQHHVVVSPRAWSPPRICLCVIRV